MSNINFGVAAALVCALAFPASGAGSEEYKYLSKRIINCANINDINKIGVLGFTPKGGAEKNETEYVTEKISTYLAGNKKPALIERFLLEKVLKEAKLSSAANDQADNAKMLQNILAVDAIVTGTVFAAGTTLKILARLIDMKTGRVLLAVETETERGWSEFPEIPDLSTERSEITVPSLASGWDTAALPAISRDFRDSISDSEDSSCSGKKRHLAKLNLELVDAKARYWAAKMKAPGFSRRNLKRNPGGEIADSEVKARFYKLLAAYYEGETSASPDPEKLSVVLDLIKMEEQVSNECGLY